MPAAQPLMAAAMSWSGNADRSASGGIPAHGKNADEAGTGGSQSEDHDNDASPVPRALVWRAS